MGQALGGKDPARQAAARQAAARQAARQAAELRADASPWEPAAVRAAAAPAARGRAAPSAPSAPPAEAAAPVATVATVERRKAAELRSKGFMDREAGALNHAKEAAVRAAAAAPANLRTFISAQMSLGDALYHIGRVSVPPILRDDPRSEEEQGKDLRAQRTLQVQAMKNILGVPGCLDHSFCRLMKSVMKPKKPSEGEDFHFPSAVVLAEIDFRLTKRNSKYMSGFISKLVTEAIDNSVSEGGLDHLGGGLVKKMEQAFHTSQNPTVKTVLSALALVNFPYVVECELKEMKAQLKAKGGECSDSDSDSDYQIKGMKDDYKLKERKAQLLKARRAQLQAERGECAGADSESESESEAYAEREVAIEARVASSRRQEARAKAAEEPAAKAAAIAKIEKERAEMGARREIILASRVKVAEEEAAAEMHKALEAAATPAPSASPPEEGEAAAERRAAAEARIQAAIAQVATEMPATPEMVAAARKALAVARKRKAEGMPIGRVLDESDFEVFRALNIGSQGREAAERELGAATTMLKGLLVGEEREAREVLFVAVTMAVLETFLKLRAAAPPLQEGEAADELGYFNI